MRLSAAPKTALGSNTIVSIARLRSIPACTAQCGSRRMRLVCRAAAAQDNDSSEPQSNIVNGFRGIRLSLFHPYKSLPPDGQIIPKHEEMCNPDTSRCKTHTYVYEEKCLVCSGTGHARSSSRHGRSKLAVCIKCQGLGYVRCTTTCLPDDISAKHDVSEHTILRNFTTEADARAAQPQP